jgi:hypothetical protein
MYKTLHVVLGVASVFDWIPSRQVVAMLRLFREKALLSSNIPPTKAKQKSAIEVVVIANVGIRKL